MRQMQRGLKFDSQRPQAKRALELWERSGLTAKHLAAVRSTGINDAGKSLQFHTGAGRNRAEKMRLAREAKEVLGGYFRELLVALPEQIGWHLCACGDVGYQAGLVLDPFAGTGTTLRVAARLGRCALGFDLRNWDEV